MKLTGMLSTAAVLLAGCGGSDGAAAEAPDEQPPSSAAPAVEEESTPPPAPEPEPEPTPNPDGTYTSSCDYLLGDGMDEYRFVADAKVTNTGNIGTVSEMKATWFLAGGDKIVERKKVRIEPNNTKRVGISRPVTGDDIDAHQSVDGDCRVVVSMIDVFGEPQ